MRRVLFIAFACLVSMAVAAGSAQAVVVDLNPAAHGQPAVAYPTDLSAGDYYGVALVPSSREGFSTTASYLQGAGIPVVSSSAPCADPAAGTEPDILTAGSWPLSNPVAPICWHSGGVMHANETFTLQWEGPSPNTYWSGTKGYVQTYLSDVAAASDTLSSPYADTSQYWDGSSASGSAANKSLFGGGCDDNGTAKCRFGSITGSGPGNQLPSSSNCPVSGDNQFGGSVGGGNVTIANNLCLTDTDIRHEVTSLINNDGLISHTQDGYTPLVVVMTPPGVKVCLDSAGALCSVNGELAPPSPTVSTSSTGGTVAPGSYQVEVTYVTSSGETVASAPTSITTNGTSSTLTIDSPPAHTGATGWYAYVTQPGGGVFSQQFPGTPVAIGTNLVLTLTPSSGGPQPPTGQASFCSYHSQVVDSQSNQAISYLVQPFTAFTGCDEPDVAPLPIPFTPEQLETNAGQRLVSPLSQAQMASITNPSFAGWFGLDGLEINDANGCHPLSLGLDTFTIGPSSGNPYYLQREFNNASVVNSDPYTYGGCLPEDVLKPAFVAPSAISLGDTVDLDGSATRTSLGIPNANYAWDFGDGTTGTGPSVAHTYAAAGTYTVKLTVTDRGGNAASLTQNVQVLTKNGLPAPPSSPTTTPGGGAAGGGSGGSGGQSGGLNVKLRLLPQGLKAAVRHGITLQVNSSEPADGFAQILISRQAARRAHLKMGHKALVMVGFGTVSGIKDGVVTLNIRMKPRLARKVARLHRVTIMVRMALTGSAGSHVVVDVAGVY